MKFCHILTPFLICFGALYGQRQATLKTENILQPDQNSTVVLNYTGEPVKVELKGAHYDFSKKFIPYFIISNSTGINSETSPVINPKKINPLSNEQSEFIKKQFGQFLGKEFNTEALSSISGGVNLNQYKLFPLRINQLGNVEQLLEYDINWQAKISSVNKSNSVTTYTANSVLTYGTWYKIAVAKNGIYKIDKTFLTKIGINTQNIDPRNIRIYGNGGVSVPELNSDLRYDDLRENAIQVIGDSDGVFNDTDYILFYGAGTDNWQKKTGTNLLFDRKKNLYSDTTYYFLTADLGPGKRITGAAPSPLPPNINTGSYDYYNHHEVDQINFIKSGREFYGEYFDITNSYSFTFSDANFVTNDTLRIQASIAARGGAHTLFSITGNGLNTTLIDSGVNINYYLAAYADVQTKFAKALNTNSGNINITVTKLTGNNIGWMDYLTVNARRNLVINKQTSFRDTRVAAPGNICNFNLTNTSSSSSLRIWNISDFLNPAEIQYTVSGTSINFISPTDSVIEFIATPDNNFMTPTFVGTVSNQNLHGTQQADYIIITHPLFMAQAQRLASLHQQNEGLSYIIATTEQVYNEFSSGKPEAAAIRDFTRMLYTRNLAAGKQPKYLLLFGDGSYDNKSRNLNTNSNLIPTYQSLNSVEVLNSVACDDFYGLMDANEGYVAENIGNIDIGVGRLTCRTLYEAEAVTSKIENYYRKDPNFNPAFETPENCTAGHESLFGDWRNWVLFMGDDEDNAEHMIEANGLANIIQSNFPAYNIDKIYLDAYQQYSTPGGQRYPDVTNDLNKRIKKGALLFNYTGHGGEVGFAAERVLDNETINSWDNYNKLPLFVTATCEFSRYDDPGRTSAGELCLLNTKGGALSLLTTCRVAYSSTNLTLNTALFNYLFKKLPDGKNPCLGDVIRRTKASIGQALQYSNFHLLGDPAITLAYPQNNVKTLKFNGNAVTVTSSDTLGALSKITITGAVTDSLGNKLNNFNGVIYPTVFNKEDNVVCLLNDNSPGATSLDLSTGKPFEFKLQKNIMYRGKSSVINGDFSFTFLVPKDISFSTGPGKISYYATNGITDASGYYKKVVVGGASKNTVNDNEGPGIQLFLNNKDFVNGGTTNERPFLYAYLNDSSGVNTVGSGIGHDISVVLDKVATKPILLNDYYEASLNTYQNGRVRYQFDNLNEGNHTLTFKVWDIQNNSSIMDVDFVVANSAEIALTHVLNYPNPFTTKTGFFFEHNQACNPLKASIQIFTVSGKLVKTITQNITCEGFRNEGITWDGQDDFGNKLARGVYVYKLMISSNDNKKAEKIEKLVILN